MTERNLIFVCLKAKLEAVGFQFETEQRSHMQNRGWELKFTHPRLVNKLRQNGEIVRGEKFYIKQLDDEHNNKIGLVNGKLTILIKEELFNSPPNSNDSFDESPAWENTVEGPALDNLLIAIEEYLDNTG